ncbi:MAG: D-arabinono-1,4-lactone oxidase [Mycobacteriaceae bacterium]
MQTHTRWSNWAGNVHSSPVRVDQPGSVEQLIETITQAYHAGHKVKVVGAGHSFTPIAATDGVQISLDALSGVESVTPNDQGALVTVFAGTRLFELNPLLWDLGFAMTNLGDIDQQSIAGAISTATHGTGAGYGGLATQVRHLQFVTADGSVLELDSENSPTIFDAARVSLGALGVISKVTLQVSPAFALKAVEAPATLDEVLANLTWTVQNSDHFEFFWFPHTRRVLTKINTRVPVDADLAPLGRLRSYWDDELLSNKLFEQVNRITTRFPASIPRINEVTSRILSERKYTDRSYRVFASARNVRFYEMEYAVPVHTVEQILAEIGQWIDDSGHTLAFPIEVRFARADDLWLSTATGRDTAYIAVHQYHRRDHYEYFRAFEKIAKSFDGRPHWGKLHERTLQDLRPVYPHLDDFIGVRDQLDPGRLFSNPHLETILG